MDQKKVVEYLLDEIRDHGVILPRGYAVKNAVMSAFLTLSRQVDRSKNPVLEVCTKKSIYDCIFSMVLQGLNPDKNQCYFIPKGKTLTMVRSYMGAEATAKAVDERIIGFDANVIFKGDKFEMSLDKNGGVRVTTYLKTMESMGSTEIVGVWGQAKGQNDSQLYIDVMTMEEVKTSWKQSRMSVSENSTHGKFTVEMMRRTVLNRLCKRIINTSNDAELLRAAGLTDEERSIDDDIEEKGNQIDIDIDAVDETPPDDIPPEDTKTEKKETVPKSEKDGGLPGWA